MKKNQMLIVDNSLLELVDLHNSSKKALAWKVTERGENDFAVDITETSFMTTGNAFVEFERIAFIVAAARCSCYMSSELSVKGIVIIFHLH